MANSNFYDELIKSCYTEKTASKKEMDKDEVKDMLSEFSTDQIEALAEELGNFYNKTAQPEETVEEKVAGEDGQAKNEDEKNSKTKKSEEKADQEESANPDDERDATGAEEAEEAKTKGEKEEMINSVAKKLEQKAASEVLDELIKESSEDDEAIVKEAYELAEEKLASAGLTVKDYILSKIDDEHVAEDISVKAEKLAYVTGKNTLQVADDIIGSICDIIDSIENSEE
jgi:DNA mismatch repair ATPase MutL